MQQPPNYILEVHLERNGALDTVQLHFKNRDLMDETCVRIIDACTGDQPNAPLMFKDDRGFAVFYPREFVSARAIGFSPIAQAPGMGQLMDFRT